MFLSLQYFEFFKFAAETDMVVPLAAINQSNYVAWSHDAVPRCLVTSKDDDVTYQDS